MNVLEFKKKLIKARDGIERETAKTILKFEKQIVDLVRENQIFRDGEDGSGNIIGVYKITVDRPFGHSNSRGYPKVRGTQVNLFDRGSLYKSFTTDYGSFVLEVFPTDSKADELMAKYGKDIFFMQVDNQRIVNFDIILPELQKFVKQTLR
jgi:hypothetical protein